ncbi:nucleoside hydrolase [Actinoplanes sp. NPDC051851]|uniref:nucleoside hydrolase n=1 Tax=Actinoplanes sp. NPDC051851 TaxID=3154753 RepID=UPI0034351D83
MLIYLDCDTGIDDAVAIAYLLAREGVTIGGIGTVNGNTSAVQAAANTLGLLTLAGREDIPVAVGAGRYQGGAHGAHGDNGIGGVVLPARAVRDGRTGKEMLKDLAREHAGELHVIATGPCGNLAEALVEAPEITTQVASVTVMGGAVRAPGNRTPVAESNIADDPASAQIVFDAPWPVTLVPLDVTMNHCWYEPDRDALIETGDRLSMAIAGMLPTYFNSYEPRLGERRIPLHDPLAAAIALGDVTPDDAPELGIRVDPGTGQTIEDPGAPNRLRVVLSLKEPAGPMLLSRITRDLRP